MLCTECSGRGALFRRMIDLHRGNNMNTQYTQFTYIFGAVFGFAILALIVTVLFNINRFIRRRMKNAGDDRVIEEHIEGGDTIHAEGVYGFKHPESPRTRRCAGSGM